MVSLRLAVLLMVLSIIGTALAVSFFELPVVRISIFGATLEDSHFVITELEIEIEGRNTIEIELTLENTDDHTQSADVAVQLLDDHGDIIIESSESTGDVDGHDTKELTFTFSQETLVEEFEGFLVVIEQTS